MKKIFGILLVSLSLFTACDDDLLEPFTPGSLTEDVAIKTSGDLARLLNSSLNFMTDRADYVFSSIYTDEAAPGSNNGGQGISSDYIFLMNVANASANQIWNVNYAALARINRVIVFADQVVPKDAADEQLIMRTKAQALVLRAICHMKIMSYYSTDLSDNSALAGVLANRVITTSESPSRATNGEFYTLIHSDLNEAIDIFNVNTAPAYSGPSNVATYYPTKVLAQAMKARAYAFQKDYANAEVFADEVINNSGINLASSLTQYNQVFHSHNEPGNTEVIFRLKRTVQQNSQATNLHNGWVSVANRTNGSPFYEVSRGLFNHFLGNNTSTITTTDYRLNNVCYLSGANSSIVDPNYATSTDVRNSDIIILQKHGGQFATTSSGGYNPDFMVSRISEMYLIKAEARAFASDYLGVASALQNIVNARYTSPVTVTVPTTPVEAWKAVLDERRKELCFEGFRFVDLKRLGSLANTGLDRDAAEYNSSAWNFPGGNPVNLPVTSFKFTLPIPVSELNANSGIAQNPGY